MIPLLFLIQRRIIALPQDASVTQASKAMCKHSVGSILVNDSQGHLVGIVTDRDLVCTALQNSKNTSTTPLSDVMTPRPLTVDISADLESVVHLMGESGIRRIPVVENVERGCLKCIGLITLDDLIASKLIDYDSIAIIVRSQIQRHIQVKHRSNSLNLFYRRIQRATNLSDQHLMPVTNAILSAIVRRLNYTGAAHFISLLPKGAQERLLELPAGPDLKISTNTMANEMARQFGYSQETMNIIIAKFFEEVGHWLGDTEIKHLSSELPENLAQLFTPPSKEKPQHLRSLPKAG
jgi:CBS domain-containing protein/uncharacterized protein (DUF2267 family)